MEQGRTPRKTNCTYHAACCGRHFHSLRAFDAHHTDDGCSTERVSSRTGEPLLEALTDEGYCGLGSPGPSWENHLHPVTIWVMAGSQDVGLRLAAERASAPEGLEGHGDTG